ncbi:hypothetical protein B0H14DRAFT_3659900 [Mycena olivaceomarginata]|nr:hypothetical protein B0H14DRAFT_3659900 [Mycena olivaceomarginata]
MSIQDCPRDSSTWAYFTSMIIFEILWLGFLSVMWLASGAAQAVENIVLTAACTTICGEARAIAAFGFLNWLILMFYTLTVMIMLVAMSRKRGRVWTESFANAPLSAPASAEKAHPALLPIKLSAGTASPTAYGRFSPDWSSPQPV